jgi:hypothetical protein
MGITCISAHSTLADVLNSQDGRIYPVLAVRLIEKDRRLHAQEHEVASFDWRSPVQEPLAGRAVLQMDQAAPAHQKILGYQREQV